MVQVAFAVIVHESFLQDLTMRNVFHRGGFRVYMMQFRVANTSGKIQGMLIALFIEDVILVELIVVVSSV
jgi:hypothetical protein